MSVSLNPPNSLGFPRPLTRLVKRDLSISNHNPEPVAFKVKTTAPKTYCVRPNSGRIEPGETAVVSVMLQALKDEPPLNSKCKDKFLIQSTIISPDKDALGLNELWAAPEVEGNIAQQKLRVTYLPPEGQTVEEEDESQVNNISSIISDSRFDTVRQVPINGTYDTSIPEFTDSQRASTPPDFNAAPEEPQPVPSVNVEPPASPEEPPVGAVVSAPAPPAPSVEYQRQIAEANAEIQRLRTLLATAPSSAAPTELRRRTKALSDDGSVADTDVGTVVEEVAVQPEGVPLQVVVIIALGVFITTYIFF